MNLDNCSVDFFIFINNVNINLNSLDLIESEMSNLDLLETILINPELNMLLNLYKKFNLIGYQSVNPLIVSDLLNNNEKKTQFIHFILNMIKNTSALNLIFFLMLIIIQVFYHQLFQLKVYLLTYQIFQMLNLILILL